MILSYIFNLHKRKVNSLNLLLLSNHSILKYLLPHNSLLIFLPKMPVIVLELVKFSTSLKSIQPISKKSTIVYRLLARRYHSNKLDTKKALSLESSIKKFNTFQTLMKI